MELPRQIAAYLFDVEEGERLPPVRELAAQFGTSVGSISEAFTSLEEAGVIEIARHGHQGSILEARSLGGLWHVARNEPLIIAHTLPSNRRYEGLAAGLKKLLSQAGIETYLIFVRGSYPRIEALRKRQCHVAVVSSFAADALCGHGERVVLELPPGSFLHSHNVYYRRTPQALGRPLRVAVDRTSFDLRRLSELEFAGQDVEFIETNFMHIRRLLQEAQVEAAIWTADDMADHLGNDISERPLSESVRRVVKGTDTSAALVANADEHDVHTLLRSVLDVKALLEIQQAVLAGSLVPEY